MSTTLKDYYESFPVGDIGNGDTQVRFSRLREEMAFQKGLMIEVGCGKGSLGKYVKSGRSFRYVGLDFSFAALKHAKANCLDDMDYVCGDLHYLPFKDSVFKALLCSEVLEHVPRIQGLFPEFARVLNSDGQFFITVPNRYHINVYFTLWITGQGIGGQKYDNPPSFSRLLSHLKSNGFAINGVHFFAIT